jgi:hypothetical protein
MTLPLATYTCRLTTFILDIAYGDQTELDTLIGVRTFTELMARSLLLDSTSKPISAGDPVTYLFRIGHEL